MGGALPLVTTLVYAAGTFCCHPWGPGEVVNTQHGMRSNGMCSTLPAATYEGWGGHRLLEV